jgi:hypothetical protein
MDGSSRGNLATLAFSSPERAYVPILLDMRGELSALASLDEASWKSTVPLIQVRPPELRTEAGAKKPVEEVVFGLARHVRAHPVYLDAGGLRRDKGAARATPGFVEQVLTSAEGLMSFRPVYPIGHPELLEAIAPHARGRGLLIRVLMDEVLELGASLVETVTSEIGPLASAGVEMELLADFGYVDPNFAVSPSAATRLLSGLQATRLFQTATIGATSVPKSISEFVNEESINGIHRKELELYREVSRSIAGVRFADYGVQNAYAPDPVHAANMVASARFTLGEYVFFSRGRGPVLKLSKQEKVEQYRAIADRLLRHPWFLGEERCCVADRIIEDCADGTVDISSQQRWRYVGTRHHIPTALRDASTIEVGAVPAAPRSSRTRVRREAGISLPVTPAS